MKSMRRKSGESMDRGGISDSPREIPVISSGHRLKVEMRLNTKSKPIRRGASVRGVITEISSRFRGTSGQFACEMRSPAGCLTGRIDLSFSPPPSSSLPPLSLLPLQRPTTRDGIRMIAALFIAHQCQKSRMITNRTRNIRYIVTRCDSRLAVSAV